MNLLKLVALSCLICPFGQAASLTIGGAAAAELYAKLAVEETEVRDEHGGPAFATAKYAENFGCQKDIDSARTECWVKQ